jgi:hypothetical protein
MKFRWPELLHIKNTTLLVIIIAWLLLVGIADHFFLSRDASYEIMDTVCFSAATGFCLAFIKSFWNSIRLPPREMQAAHLFTAGAWISSFSLAWVFAGQFYWRSHDRQAWIIDSFALLYSRAFAAIGLIILMTAIFARRGEIEPSGYWRSMIFVTLFLFIGTFLVFGFG